jgi:tRNA pseudouridine38-40 synthase
MMQRYFIEIAYKGTAFNGFQIQDNAATIQGEINKALSIIFKEQAIETTTSSRTDAGVHAYQNFLHWDTDLPLPRSIIYSINAILHTDIAVTNIYPVDIAAHARFDALGRKYAYHLHNFKDPFSHGQSYYFPFKIDRSLLQITANMLLQHQDFTSFSKKNTDVHTYICTIKISEWEFHNEHKMTYHVESNRFLRGMVKALVGTQLLVARGKISLTDFEQIILSKDCNQADFSPVSEGLFLEQVNYPDTIFGNPLPYK